jgi:hypothetical protein
MVSIPAIMVVIMSVIPVIGATILLAVLGRFLTRPIGVSGLFPLFCW